MFWQSGGGVAREIAHRSWRIGNVAGRPFAGGALTTGEVYDKPIAQVRAELAAMPVEGLVLHAVAGSDGTKVKVRQTADSIIWHFMIGGHEVSVFTATLNEEGRLRTRVRLAHTPGANPIPEVDRLNSTAMMRSMSEIAMAERVDARLENRSVDDGELMLSLGQHLSDNPEQVREYGLAIGQMYKDMGDQFAANANAASAEPDPKVLMEKATRPSIVLP